MSVFLWTQGLLDSAPAVADVYYGAAEKFRHQARFLKIERWFQTEPEAHKIVSKAAETARLNADYDKAVSKYLNELIALSEMQLQKDKAKQYFNTVIAQEIERQEAEAAFAAFVVVML